jgi:hypothetical protein
MPRSRHDGDTACIAPVNGLYRAYGLTIRSALALPELPAATGEADVDIVLGPVRDVAGWRQAGPRLFGSADALRFGPTERAQFMVTGGRRMVIQLGPFVTTTVVRPFILSSGMGAVLHQRAFLPLHASVVATDDGCVALMGHRGIGKSTLAAFIATAGGAAVADDVCAVTFAGGEPWAWPSRQRFKLADDAVAHLGLEHGSAERLPLGKLSVTVRTTPDDGPRRLRAAFILATGAACAVRRLTMAEALAALLEHTYRPRHVIALGIEREHFQRCASLAAAIPVHALSTVRDLSRLGDVAALVAQSSDTPLIRSSAALQRTAEGVSA